MKKGALKNGKKSYTSYLMILVVFAVIYALRQFDILNAYWYQVLQLCCVNAIVAMSLNLINGMTGQFSLGQAGFMSVGAYTAAMLTKLVFAPMMNGVVSTYGLFFLSVLIAALTAALIGFLIGIPSLRLRGDYLAIITLGFSEIIRVLWRVVPFAGKAKGLNGIRGLTSFPILFVTVVLVMLLLRNFTRSAYGRSCVAIRDNELAAETMGINTTRKKIISFVFSAFIAGIGGAMYAHLMMFINPEMFNQIKSTDMLMYLYAGGVGSYSSALLGAVIFTILPEFLRVVGEWRLVIFALTLVVIMLNRPKGLFGKHEFGFMRFGEPESVWQKADDAGIVQELVAKLKHKSSKKVSSGDKRAN